MAVGIGLGVLAINSLPFALRSEMTNQNDLIALRLSAEEARIIILETRQNNGIDRLNNVEREIVRLQTELGDRQGQKSPGG